MKYVFYAVLTLAFASVMTSCAEDSDDSLDDVRNDDLDSATASPINDFIWKGLNAFYLYKDDVADLANDRFTSNQEYADFLNTFDTPEAIFDGLLTKETVIVNGETFAVDEFSFLVDDYVALEQAFDGISQSNGMDFGLVRYPNSPSDVFGYVRYVLPNTSASENGVQRGDIFNEINGTQITDTNFSDLLGLDSYTIGLATFDGENVTSTEETIALTKAEYTENPVFITKTIEVGESVVGYLMYNSFTGDFDADLNNAFAELKAANVTELVLDLRYNGGGSVATAIDLSSMITGQFEGEVFTTEEWNSGIQQLFTEDQITNLFNNTIRTDEAINSLNLTKVYVLTTGSSASASELVINGLDPYIDVVQIGTTTSGKFQASITLYDSDNFFRTGDNLNEDHTYAIQPLVLRSVNAAGVTDYFGGFAPDIVISEDLTNLGTLGDEEEPLLKAALDDISGAAKSYFITTTPLEIIGESKMKNANYQRMYHNLEETNLSVKRSSIQ